MGDMFRSEEMALCQMFIQPEAAYASIAELGENGCVQFRDLNSDVSSFQRKFVSEVRRCDNLERQIRYIENEIKKDELILEEMGDEVPLAPNPREIIDLEAQLESIENEIRELSQNGVGLKNNYLGLIELKQILENTSNIFSDEEVLNLDSNRFRDPSDPAPEIQSRGQLSFVAGVIKLERFFSFERMLWRISRGNIFLKRADIDGLNEDIETGKQTLKTVFIAFFQGEQLKQRIKKICEGFHASTYPCPSAFAERDNMVKDVLIRLEDLKMVLNQTQDHRNRVLVAASRNLPTWSAMVKKMKAIYHTLNLFNMDVSRKCLIGEGWVPVSDLHQVQKALAKGSASVESTIPSFLNVIETNEQPPTLSRTNKFTSGFQNLISAYGIASYREVNPALYTCITFPFLFAVMFGDLGHGFILFLIASYMCYKEQQLSKIKGEIFNIFFGGRYIIILMGIFSMYTGFVYNDLFSKSMNIFGSGWKVRYNTSTVIENEDLTLDPRYALAEVYPYGMDPIWALADNKIIFQNAFKMKLSIIFGVVHMMFGVVMSFINFNYFKQRMNIVLLFLPQMIFLVVLFAYLVFLMFFKWVKYSGNATDFADTPGCAPSILILFINMMLFGSTVPADGCKEFMFSGQNILQYFCVALALISIPWMLLGKPLYVKHTRKNNIANNPTHNHENGDMNGTPNAKPANQPAVGGHGSDDEPINEVFIQQAIHTIEYVLSTISHTASYLRLWALSLAHAQLSEVLWDMTLRYGFILPPKYGGFVLTYLVFWGWSALTVGILVLIEGLSAFLHTLRLHWVEFMSKFYCGEGYAFQPFCFKTVLKENHGDYTE